MLRLLEGFRPALTEPARRQGQPHKVPSLSEARARQGRVGPGPPTGFQAEATMSPGENAKT